MTQRTLTDITAEQARALLDGDAVLVDVREPHEQAVERIPNAIQRPLSRLAEGAAVDLPAGMTAVFLCASGARTRNNSMGLAALVDGQAFCMTGGIAAWKRAGYPTERG